MGFPEKKDLRLSSPIPQLFSPFYGITMWLTSRSERIPPFLTSAFFFVEQMDKLQLGAWKAFCLSSSAVARHVHSKDCVASSPTTHGSGDRTLCECGRGKDVPPIFVESMKSLELDGENILELSCFYRAAVSPLYNPPGMMLPVGVEVLAGKHPEAGTATNCSMCGKEGAAMRCSRCKRARYYSKECQRLDWKSHKPACG